MSTAKKEGKPRGKRTLTTAAKRAKFLEVYAKSGGNISTAAKQAQINRHKHYEWLNDPKYEQAFARANTEANDLVEREIFRRGHDGILKPVFYQGKKAGTVREYSDTLLIFFAKGRMPEKYRDNFKGEVVHTGGVEVNHRLNLKSINDEQLEQLESIFRLAAPGGDTEAPDLCGRAGGEAETGQE